MMTHTHTHIKRHKNTQTDIYTHKHTQYQMKNTKLPTESKTIP